MKLSKPAKIGIGAAAVAAIVAVAYFVTRAEAFPGEYCCPYCGECFDSYADLVDHVKEVHPGERIPLPIEWD